MRFTEIFTECSKHLNDTDFIAIAAKFGQHYDPYNKMVRDIIKPTWVKMIIQMAGDGGLERLYQSNPEYFGLEYTELKHLCDRHGIAIPSDAQLQYLVRHGQAKVANPRIPPGNYKNIDPIIDMVYRHRYDVVSVLQLPE